MAKVFEARAPFVARALRLMAARCKPRTPHPLICLHRIKWSMSFKIKGRSSRTRHILKLLSLSLLFLSALFLPASRQDAQLGGRRGIALLWKRDRWYSRVQADGGDGVDGVVCWLARYGFPAEQSELGEVHADDLCLCVRRSSNRIYS